LGHAKVYLHLMFMIFTILMHYLEFMHDGTANHVCC